MTKIIIFLLLTAPVFATAVPAADVKPRNAQAEVKNKTDVYRTITGELLKNCEGADKKIAVAGFSYSDGRDSRDGGVVAERITTELVKLKKFKVIERKEIEKVFEELKLQRSGAINPDSAKEIGKMLGADWVVVGTLTELPDKQLELNTRLVSVESGEIITASSDRIEKNWLDQYRKLLDEQNKVIEKNPKDVQAFYTRGKMYVDLREDDNAIASFSIVIAIDPKYTKAYSMRGLVYWRKHEYNKAIEDCSKAIIIDPKDTKAYFVRGLSYYAQGEYNKTIEDFSKAIKNNPTQLAFAYFSRGEAYLRKDEHDKAIEDYSKAIAIDPKDPTAYSKRGLAYYAKREYDKAIEDCSKAIAINPKYANAYGGRELAYRAKGEYEKAAADEEKYQSLLQK